MGTVLEPTMMAGLYVDDLKRKDDALPLGRLRADQSVAAIPQLIAGDPSLLTIKVRWPR